MIKRKSSVVFLLVAVLCGVIAALLSGTVLSLYAETASVYVVVRDVEAGEAITADLVGQTEMPAAAVPAGAVANLSEVEGKHLRFGLVQGSVLQAGHVAEMIQGGRLTATLTQQEGPEMRALAIPFSGIVSVGGAVASGDRVDLIAGMTVQDNPVTRIIARDVHVLSVIPEGGGVPSVILAVTPELAEELVFVLQNGALYAALNPYGADNEAYLTEGFYNFDSFVNRHSGSPELPLEGDPAEEQPDEGGAVQ